MVARFREYLREAGRSVDAVALERRVAVSAGPEKWMSTAEEWRRGGGRERSLSTMNAGFVTPDQHIGAMRRFRETVR